MITAQQIKMMNNQLIERDKSRWKCLTEGQPCLLDLQVDREVCLQAQVTDGDVCARFSLQGGVLHVAVENP